MANQLGDGSAQESNSGKCARQHPSFLMEGIEMAFAVILMGSMSDRPFVEPITTTLDKLGITYECRVASAHKGARYLLDLLSEYETYGRKSSSTWTGS
jgi:phosphoribosylcarboxyaminoimidazole (NCAIR) mutase